VTDTPWDTFVQLSEYARVPPRTGMRRTLPATQCQSFELSRRLRVQSTGRDVTSRVVETDMSNPREVYPVAATLRMFRGSGSSGSAGEVDGVVAIVAQSGAKQSGYNLPAA
jgi:hypothetical protein